MRREPRAGIALVAIVLVAIASGGQGLARPKSPPGATPLPPHMPLPPALAAQAATPQDAAKTVIASIALADIGFKDGIRLANLGARREVFVPLPQDANVKLAELTLSYDDLTAFKARRNLEVLVNDRSIAAVPLEGNDTGRTLRVPLVGTSVRDGFIKLTFLYSGAATPDRCIDVRYVGDSLTIRPDTAIDVEFHAGALRDVTTIAALMPRDVTVALPERALSGSEFAAALTVARALAATGRRSDFSVGPAKESEPAEADGRQRWMHGMIVIGAPVTGAIPGDSAATVPGVLSAIRVGGMPALLLSDVTTSMRAARLLATPAMAAARGMARVAVAGVAKPQLPTDRVTFDQLGLRSPPVDVYGRAELSATLDTRKLPANTQASRLALDVLVAPDGAGDKAVVSLFINGHFLASTVAATDGPTHLEQPLPEGLVGTVANINVVVQRRSAAGDCRFEPQGYPAQILGSSAVILSPSGMPHDFADLATRWANGIEVLVPPDAARQPQHDIALLSAVLSALSPQIAPVTVRFAEPGAAPSAPFIAVSTMPPQGATPRVRFDRGRVAVKDSSGRTLLDLGGFNSGAIAQLVEASGHPGIWINALAADGQLPSPAALKLDRGDVAFLDQTGVALAMSTVRDTLVLISYPDQASWTTISGRFRSWIFGSLWLLATVVFLFVLQRMLRRRARATDE
jgi:hypothetical protein